jgi:hypothetical protein
VEKIKNEQEQHFTFARMGNLLALLLNATRFFTQMSKKRQRCAVVSLENNFRQILQMFTVIVSNNSLRISGKMDFITEEKACSKYNSVYESK